jgi:hypothetical protein
MNAYKKLHEKKDSAKLRAVRGEVVGLLFYTFLSHITKRRGYVMPIELLVPIAIFGLGIVVSVTLGGIGIDQVLRASKK